LATAANAQGIRLAQASAAGAPADPPAAVPADAYYSNGNGSDNGWHASGDVGFYILKPQWRSNPAYVTSISAGNKSIQSVKDFDFALGFVPKISIGAENGCGFGVRVNWWGLANATSGNAAVTSAGTDNAIESAFPLGAGFAVSSINGVFQSRASLRMTVFDLEATQDMQLGQWALKLSGGLRYAHIAQSYDATLIGTEFGAAVLDKTTSGHSFNGVGPTASIDVQYRICSSNWSLYANARGSLLFGRTRQSASLSESFQPNGRSVITTVAARSAGSDATLIPVGEIEVGARWERECGRRLVYVQAGFVGQVWFDAGNSSRAAPVLEGDSLFTDAGASPTDSNLGLLGFNISAGLRW
jgi:hypothetical protein